MAKQSIDARYSASQVGLCFVEQYYKVFLQQRESLYRFYSDESCVIRVDGKISRSASNKEKIHELIMSLNLVEIEIKTVNSLESLNGGVLLVVSGFAKLRDFSGQMKFLQTFFLAPQEEGYFVLNDMFHFVNDEVVHQPSAPSTQEQNVDMFHFANDEVVHQPSAPATQAQNVDYQQTISTHLPADRLVSDSGNSLEEEVNDCISSLHIQGEKSVEEFDYQKLLQIQVEKPVEEFDYQKLLQPQPEQETNPESEPELELQPELEPEPIQEPEVNSLEEKISFEESTALLKNNEISVLQPLAETVKQSTRTYASVLMAKGKSPPSISSQPPLAHGTRFAVDSIHASHPSLQQSCSILPNSTLVAVEEPLSSAEEESEVVYVKNLSSTVTSLDILYKLKNFGKIKHDGVSLRNRQDTGACYAFVEFEDVQSALNAIKASPIQLAGRRVYIEQKKSKVGSSRGGIRGGRGSGGLGGRTSGRESEQNCSGNGGVGTNGFR